MLIEEIQTAVPYHLQRTLWHLFVFCDRQCYILRMLISQIKHTFTGREELNLIHSKPFSHASVCVSGVMKPHQCVCECMCVCVCVSVCVSGVMKPHQYVCV